ncbi:MAG: HlyD family efflux transporter periplasmic adaptor subunit [bacterium]|nr:HlyD family efflux transporter periplasmic adaptor subunit [bacterium]
MAPATSQPTPQVPVRFEVVLEFGDERHRGIVRGLGPDGLSVLVPPQVGVPDRDRSVEVICDALPEHPARLRGRVAAIEPHARDPRGREMTELDVELADGPQDAAAIAALVDAFRGAVLLCGFAAPAAEELSSRSQLAAAVLTAETTAQALELLAHREIAVLCLGAELAGREAADLLRRTLELAPSPERCNIVLAAGPELELFQDFVDDDQVYYLTPQPPPLSDVRHILRSALGHYEAAARLRTETVAAAAETVADAQSILEMSHHLARESTVERAAILTAQAIERLIEADRAYCLIYDPATETLWTPQPGGAEERRESAAAGLVSFVIRTGTAVELEHVGVDPRYDPEADTDRGASDQRFLAVPVATAERGSAEHQVLAVAVALRDASRQPFSDRDRESLQLLTEQIAPTFARFVLQARLDELNAERHGAMSTEAAKIFRPEALEHHTRGFQDQGHLLELSPDWIRWAYRLLLGVFVAAVLYSVLGSIHEYAPGLAVVRVEGLTEVNAKLAGTVTSVEIEAGRRVDAGELLVRFYGVREVAEVDRIQREFELGLINRLRNPADRTSERALSALRAQKQLAEARLEERSVRAPHAGIVADLRIRPGQHLSPGQSILSLIGDNPELRVVALFPGHYRPLIELGMPLRLELQGYKYAYQHLVVDGIGEEVVGPAEAGRVLGASIADAVPLTGPVIFVHARLPAKTFESGGRVYEYHDGMQGRAEVRVRSESILTTLIPGLKAVLSDAHG